MSTQTFKMSTKAGLESLPPLTKIIDARDTAWQKAPFTVSGMSAWYRTENQKQGFYFSGNLVEAKLTPVEVHLPNE